MYKPSYFWPSPILFYTFAIYSLHSFIHVSVHVYPQIFRILYFSSFSKSLIKSKHVTLLIHHFGLGKFLMLQDRIVLFKYGKPHVGAVLYASNVSILKLMGRRFLNETRLDAKFNPHEAVILDCCLVSFKAWQL